MHVMEGFNVKVLYENNSSVHNIVFKEKEGVECKYDTMSFNLDKNQVEYLTIDGHAFNNVPPEKTELMLLKNSFYRVKLDVSSVKGSVIFYIVMFDVNKRIGDFSIDLLEGSDNQFVISTGDNHQSSKIAFRLIGGGELDLS